MAAALLRCALLCAALGCAGAAMIPPADVKVEVLHKPFICHRKTKWGDMMLVHYEGYLERDGSMFHSVKIYLKKEFEKHGAVVNDTQHDALVEDIFDKEDEDSDGFISAREFTYKHDEL
ncbi:peptidyl-prolyl cis-trans isomerase FKBP14 [Empidonax traillii]|uniref:peptidyl-prolyl cis-trans isomerase FKBP14 n=1 Tax=Empidonax traillii TaxID=164674 RepID=UPI000FFCE742|nr:peptidyl-prolyl cis-trans isomerase FKBP14 [Empidonax traillii]